MINMSESVLYSTKNQFWWESLQVFINLCISSYFVDLKTVKFQQNVSQQILLFSFRSEKTQKKQTRDMISVSIMSLIDLI